MNVIKIFAALCCLLISAWPGTGLADAPAVTQSATPAPEAGKGAISVTIDPEMQKLDSAYQEAAKKFTPEQQAILKPLEEEFLKTTAADAEILATSLQLKHCAARDNDIAKNKSKYNSEFTVYRNQLHAAQERVKARILERRAATAPFVDQKVLDDHYAYMARITIGVAKGMMEDGYGKGAFDKTDCRTVADKLDAASSDASAATASPKKIAEIQKAAAAGDPEAMTVLGMLKISGAPGVKKDTAKGVALLTLAAERGYDRAQYMLGLSVATDMFGLTPDRDKAKYWLGKAAAQGNAKAATMLKGLEHTPPLESIDAIRKKAEAGDARAGYDLGFAYAHGLRGLAEDRDLALKYLLLSAGQGLPQAQAGAAVLLLGADRAAEGIEWMTKAANNGVANSQVELGDIYLEGRLVPKDEEKAVFWYRKAAAAGNTRAANTLLQMGRQ